MPYTNVPESQWGKMDDCKKKVMDEHGYSEERAIAICHASIVEGKELKEVIAESAATKDAANAAEHLRLAIELHQAHLDGSEPTDEESQEALMVHLRAALDELGEEAGESEKGEEHPWHRGRPGEIGGSTSSGAGGAGGEGGASAYRGGDREEWNMVNRRLAAGGLKRGERALLERRAEKLAMRLLGVKEKKSLKSLILDTVMSLFGVPKAKESQSAFDAGAVGAVFKQADGRYRWVLFSSNSFEDGDREIVSQKALEDDVRHSDATKEYGPLLWWHERSAELGACDFRAMHDKMLVESGTFHLEAVGQKMAKVAPALKASLGFYHPLSQPDSDGVFETVRTFERSMLPMNQAANKLTALPVITRKESSMETKKLEALKELLGDDLAAQVVQKADEQTKAAQDAGVRFKEEQKQTTKQDMMEEPEASAEETPAEGATVTADEVVQIVTDAVTPVAEAVMSVADAVEIVASEVGIEEEVAGVIEAPMTEEAKAARKKRREERYAARGKAIGKLAEATKRLEAAETEIKRLTGGLPRAIKTGFRASAAPETVVSEEKTKEINPPPDPFVEFTNAVVLGKRP